MVFSFLSTIYDAVPPTQAADDIQLFITGKPTKQNIIKERGEVALRNINSWCNTNNIVYYYFAVGTSIFIFQSRACVLNNILVF